jgi:enoyl-CoA hydratase/carnithine racemase
MAESLILRETKNGVTTLSMNNPRKLNGWTEKMMGELQSELAAIESDSEVHVVILTGADPYYCAGVNLSGALKLEHPKKMKESITSQNYALFGLFIDFKKPIIVAANGPAIGGAVTSATLCDAIIASDKATFSTPFARLGVTPEGCSSVHFERLMGADNAERMLGDEGFVPTAEEALEMGLIDQVVPHDALLETAQALAETWIEEGRTRQFRAGLTQAEASAINAEESPRLAAAFLDSPFILGQAQFLRKKKKWGPAILFYSLWITRPVWSRFS